MRRYLELARRSVQRHFAYRAAALAGLITNFFFGLVRMAILLALYGQQQQVAGIDLQGIVTYAALTQAVITFLSLFGWYEIADSVHSGEIASDLLKPVNFFVYWLARDAGRALVGLLLRGVTLILLYSLMFEMATPQSTLQWLAVLLAMFLSWLLSFSWIFIVNLAAFWTPNARGAGRFVFLLSWILSGFLMPLRFFPDWFVRLAYLTPFPHMINTVVEVYLGLLSGPELLQALLLQAFWIAGLIALGQLVLRRGVHRLVILGG